MKGCVNAAWSYNKFHPLHLLSWQSHLWVKRYKETCVSGIYSFTLLVFQVTPLVASLVIISSCWTEMLQCVCFFLPGLMLSRLRSRLTENCLMTSSDVSLLITWPSMSSSVRHLQYDTGLCCITQHEQDPLNVQVTIKVTRLLESSVYLHSQSVAAFSSIPLLSF